MTRAPLLRPEFGPTLPVLIHRRFGLSVRASAAIALGALVLLAVIASVVVGDGRKTVVVHGKPTFNVLYDPGVIHRVTPRPGELLRLQGNRKHLSVAFTVRRLSLPPYSGDVIGGQLPLFTSQYVSRLRARLPDLQLRDEGKARLNQALGYQLGYTSGTAGNRAFWREAFLLPPDSGADQAVTLTLRQTFSGRTGPRDQALLKAMKKAFRSFRFGTSRPLFQGG
jgi:hypothetical protein